MAVDTFLKIDGIKGESKDDKHKDEIDVQSWSWGMSQLGTMATGGGGGAGRANVQDLSFTKQVDKSTPDLMLSCISGKHIKEATLVCRKASGDVQLDYLTIKLTDVLISSVQTGGSGGGGEVVMESVSINFAKVNVDYKEQTAKGAVGATPKMGWDIKANKKL
jgi:type VI secretion system secreted protein Hcp